MTAATLTRPGIVAYRMTGGERFGQATAEGHLQVTARVHVGAEAEAVKAAIGKAMTLQCGRLHRVQTRRINRDGSVVLHWSVKAWCWPVGGKTISASELAELPLTQGVFRPVNPADAEAEAEALATAAAEAVGAFYAAELERKAAERKAATAGMMTL